MKRAMLAVFVVVLLFVTGTAFAQNSGDITLDMKNGLVGDFLIDFLLDYQEYQNKPISINNLLFGKFRAQVNSIAYRPTSDNWFKDSGTYRFWDDDYDSQMRNNHFYFWFHPADREGLRFMLSLDGKYLPIMKVNIKGIYLRQQSGSGTITYNIFLVTSFDIDGKTYTGTIPTSVGSTRVNTN